MTRDIRKLGEWLEKVCQEGVAVERKILEWKIAEEEKAQSTERSKASYCRLLLLWQAQMGPAKAPSRGWDVRLFRNLPSLTPMPLQNLRR